MPISSAPPSRFGKVLACTVSQLLIITFIATHIHTTCRLPAGQPYCATSYIESEAYPTCGGDYLRYLYHGAYKESRGDFKGALADYDRAVALKPNKARGLLNRALLRARMGDRVGAINDLSLVIQTKEPDMTDYALRARADNKLALGDKAGALMDFDRAVSISPNNPSFRSGRAIVCMSLGDYARASEDTDLAIKLSQGYDVHAYHDKVLLALRTGRLKEAKAAYDQGRKSVIGHLTPKELFDEHLRRDLAEMGGSLSMLLMLEQVIQNW